MWYENVLAETWNAEHVGGKRFLQYDFQHFSPGLSSIVSLPRYLRRGTHQARFNANWTKIGKLD